MLIILLFVQFHNKIPYFKHIISYRNNGYNEGSASSSETIIYYFAGKEVLASDKKWGGSGGAWMSSVTYTCKGLVVSNIDPQIFSRVRYSGTWAYGSSSGDYPNQDRVSGHYHVNFIDTITGEMVKTTGRGDNVTVDLSSFTNPVDMYIDATITNSSWGDPWASCTLGNVYLKIRDN